MKDSGVAWIGEIPKGWGVSRLKNLFRIKKNIAGQEGYDVLSVTQKGIKIKDLTKNEGQLAKDYSNYQLVEKNDFVMNHMDLLTGYVDCSNFMGVTSPDYRVFYCVDNKTTNREYYLYILQACYTNKIFYGLGQGVSGFGRWRLPANQFLLFELPIPSFSEQQSIANYLDEKCAEIDNLISLLEEMIGELKAYKQSVITETVCKGLNKNAPMKDSGIEWIGEIPKNWGVAKIKNFVAIKNGKEVLSSEGDIPVYGSGGVFGKTNNIMAYGESVLMGRKGTIDKPKYISEGSPFWCVDTVFYTSKKPICHMMYFYYCVSSIDYNEHIYGTALPSMTQTILNNINMPFPALTEQQTIASYLDEKCGNIEGLISIKQAKIDELEEFKKSLIYEYVTGKKSVI